MELHAVKGTGREHAKFSPVATAYYRLLPHVELLRPIEGQDAERLQKCFSPGVIDLVEEEGTGKKVAKVKDARYDICSRNVYRHEDLADAVKLTRSRDHFICQLHFIFLLHTFLKRLIDFISSLLINIFSLRGIGCWIVTGSPLYRIGQVDAQEMPNFPQRTGKGHLMIDYTFVEFQYFAITTKRLLYACVLAHLLLIFFFL